MSIQECSGTLLCIKYKVIYNKAFKIVQLQGGCDFYHFSLFQVINNLEEKKERKQ
jgi:hypothetical protein